MAWKPNDLRSAIVRLKPREGSLLTRSAAGVALAGGGNALSRFTLGGRRDSRSELAGSAFDVQKKKTVDNLSLERLNGGLRVGCLPTVRRHHDVLPPVCIKHRPVHRLVQRA